MKTTFKIFLLLWLFGTIQSAKAQKKPYYNLQEEAVNAAQLHLDREMKNGELTEWATERGMQGNYALMITIGGKKGEVLTIRPLSRSEDGSIIQQNAIKDYVMGMRFPFKMPKNKSYQFEYEFKF